MKSKNCLFIIIAVFGFSITSCKKFLDKKSVQNLSTPGTYDDLEAILNNQSINQGTALLNGMSDEYYLPNSNWQSLTELPKEGYVWDAQLNDYNDWSQQYFAIFNANTVLYNLDLVGSKDQSRYNIIRGSALFFRAQAFFRLLLLYAKQYDPNSASSDLGIPLRLTADINETSVRATVQASYQQIVSDLVQATSLLPALQPTDAVLKTHPSKVAVYGLLSRIYLQMGNYAKAQESASAALSIYSTLMDFNDASWVKIQSAASMVRFNPETIFYSFSQTSPNSNSAARIDSLLYKSYSDNDLRKTAYFSKNSDGSYRFKGSYAASTFNLFCGVATDELYLIRAETEARSGAVSDAMKDLNSLLTTRWKTGTYIDVTANNADDALSKILVERRKELVYRELRWPDLKRLNKEGGRTTTLTRLLSGQTITLPPNDLRYALLIPREVIAIVSLPQNPR